MKKKRVEITAIRRTAIVLCHQPVTGSSYQPRPDHRPSDQINVASLQLRGLMPADAAGSPEPTLLIDVLVKSDNAGGLDREQFDPHQSGNYTRLLSLGISIRSCE